MASDFMQRQVSRLLEQAEAALDRLDWSEVRTRAEAVLALDPANADAQQLIEAARRAIAAAGQPGPSPAEEPPLAPAQQPTSFANGRYEVRRFLGEGGKKRVYLAHDTLLDRDVAFALIKTEGLDQAARERITREAQAMGRLGDHPNIVTVYDIGEENGQPYLVLPLLPGGDVEGLIEKAEDHKLPIEQAVRIAVETCQGLEFAHTKGIVHRDIKPGNVWLAEDGRVQVGDFGLAVAVDRSRLTQAGMMVGTVSYMPPEQAMGGEVGPRSDLYSLGAMLYEMVCGRPPFVGDESVAIIGQHLNTPPVAPSWHRPDCPPALEALILRLLEKNPEKRPGSAAEVKQALESIETPVRAQHAAPLHGASSEVPAVATPDPLYRRTFVGRESELRQLQSAFDAAISGQGGLVMVVGEPGIGKTALCEQLMTYVAMRGGKTLAGHCYEEGSLSLPYLAFVEAMRSYVLAREPDVLRSELGTGAADVARIVSEIRDRLAVDLRPPGDPEDDRWRLLQAVTTFLRNASTVQPLLIVLEDLHWADRGTLDLLLHVARNLQGARILIAGNYRDIEVDRAHPLSGALVDLRRAGSFHSIRLRGLSIDEVQRMMTNIRGQEIPLSRAELIHRQTEGNPLFVQEVIRYLVEEGIVVREGGRYGLSDPAAPDAGIPEGLRDVVGKRLSRLSPECNRLLAVAAVIGREFNLETLRALTLPSPSQGEGVLPGRTGEGDAAEEALLSSLEEAVRVGVLEERSQPGQVSYRFAHAFFRQTLYEEMIAPRRLRLHQEIARALEAQYGQRREEHAAELAEHFAQSTDHADLAKAVEYGELAARRAMSVYAYAEAASHLERTLAVQEVLNPDDKAKRCDLLTSLGTAALGAGEPLRVLDEIMPSTFSLAEAIEDEVRACEAAQLALDALDAYAGWRAFWDSRFEAWAQRLDKYAPSDGRYRVLANIARLNDRGWGGQSAEAPDLASRTMALAREVGDPQLLLEVAACALLVLRRPINMARRLEVATEAVSWSRVGLNVRTLDRFLRACGFAFLATGDRKTAEELWRERDALAARTQDATVQMGPFMTQIRTATFDGRLEDALDAAERMVRRGDEIGASVIARQYASGQPHWARRYLGRLAETTAYLEGVRNLINIDIDQDDRMAVVRVIILAESGQVAEARSAAHATWERYKNDQYPLGTAEVLAWLDAALEAGVTEIVQECASALEPLSHLNFTGVVARLLGGAAALLGKPDEARSYYEQAFEVAAKIASRPETALTHLQLAELLLEHYPEERDAAIEHLDFAIAEFRDMKMQPSLERALRHRGLLKA